MDGDILHSTVPASTTTETWHHYVTIRDSPAKQVKFYVDGLSLGAPVDYANNTSDGSDTKLWIGRCQTIDAWELQGDVDEVRLSATERSSDWIRAQYLSMTEKFVVFGVPQP